MNHTQINQEKIFVEDKDRFKHLLAELSLREGSVIIFVRTKSFTEKLAKMLKQEGTALQLFMGTCVNREELEF